MSANQARTIEQGGPWLEVFGDDVEATAPSQSSGEPGPLADFTFAIKDLIAVAGRTLTAGSPVLADAAPETMTAPIVESLVSWCARFGHGHFARVRLWGHRTEQGFWNRAQPQSPRALPRWLQFWKRIGGR